MNIRRALPRLALALLLLTMIGWAIINRDAVNVTAFDAWLRSLGPWAPICYVIGFALATVAFVPGAIFTLAGGAVFGPFWGSLLSLAGATIGAVIAFLTARYLTADWVERKASGFIKRFIEGVDAEGWRFVALVRLVPLFPFNLSNYALGLTRIPLLQYTAATIVCMAPGAVAYSWLGYAGRGALTGESNAVQYALIGLGLLVAIAFLPGLVNRIRGAISWIGACELKEKLEHGEAVTVIDVRAPDEFSGPLGHIATARNIPVGELRSRLNELAGCEGKSLVTVCKTDKRSANAAKILGAAGYTQVSVLRRGMESWNEIGLPVSRSTPQAQQIVGHREAAK